MNLSCSSQPGIVGLFLKGRKYRVYQNFALVYAISQSVAEHKNGYFAQIKVELNIHEKIHWKQRKLHVKNNAAPVK